MSDTIEPRYSDVHTEHCCLIHGCKYKYDVYDRERFGVKLECTVTSGQHSQTHPCEACNLAWNKPRFIIEDGKLIRKESFEDEVLDSLETMTDWATMLKDRFDEFPDTTGMDFETLQRNISQANKLLRIKENG